MQAGRHSLGDELGLEWERFLGLFFVVCLDYI